MAPAMLDDPAAAAIYRVSGEPPYPTADHPALPETIYPRQVTLRDRVTIATLLPFASADQVPPQLLAYLSEQLNREIDKGDTYPMISRLSAPEFGDYWFQNFGAIMVMGEVGGIDELLQIEHDGADWSKMCLGSFYIKPNYPGRSSHICNGGFLVTDMARNKGVGRLMGEGYLEWAPQLGYTYSVFNLVYETNTVSCRIWDALGFKRIGRIKGAGALRSSPDELIDAIIYGRDLGAEGEDFVSEERFDKIRYYLKQGRYPAGADRAEKSRLRSAATHYKLLPNPEGGEERLMLKDKEVVADAQRQYDIARAVHMQTHGGINKTTASIAERYHWVRIKETVSLVIKNCADCKESNKPSSARPDNGGAGTNGGHARKPTATAAASASNALGAAHDPNRDIERLVSYDGVAPGVNHLRSPSDFGNGTRRRGKPPPLQGDVEMHNGGVAAAPTSAPTGGPLPPQQQQPPPVDGTEPHTPTFHGGNGTGGNGGNGLQTPFTPQHAGGPPQHSPQQQPPAAAATQTPQPAPTAPMAPMHGGMRGYEDLPLDPQMMSYASHGLAGGLAHPSLAHPHHPHPGHPHAHHGMPNHNHHPQHQHQLSDQPGLPPGMNPHHHPMNDPSAALAPVDAQHPHAMGMGLGAMGSLAHPGPFDMPAMPPHPGAHPGAHPAGGMGLAGAMNDDDRMDARMDGAPDGVPDGELGRTLMDAGYGGGGAG